MSDFFTVTADECQAIIAENHAELDARSPGWRTRLARCCLHCSDVAPGVWRYLDAANTAQWLLDGTNWRGWRP